LTKETEKMKGEGREGKLRNRWNTVRNETAEDEYSKIGEPGYNDIGLWATSPIASDCYRTSGRHTSRMFLFLNFAEGVISPLKTKRICFI
jgi:hypothetical protein